jgi:DNA-binding response OmpR family regulator
MICVKTTMNEKIYIVEDDDSIQDMLKIVLEKEGYEVNIDPLGNEVAENNHPPPDLFLLDRQLPNRDGLDICRYLKTNKKTEKIPVIMISATPQIEELSKLAGADDFLEKPFSINTLLKTIKTHLHNHKPEQVIE